MGKKLHQQRRGKGSNAYTKPPNSKADVAFGSIGMGEKTYGEVVEFIDDPAHAAPLMLVKNYDNSENVLIAPEGIKIGDKIEAGAGASLSLGSVMKLKDVPEGMFVYNIEARPGDGGKFVRAPGTYASVVSHSAGNVTISLPSKEMVTLSEECRAEVGVVAGGGAKAQPLMKAGKNFYIKHARNRWWPKNRGVKMNPVDHPFGGKQHHKGASSEVARGAPPGQKVGHIAARRVGRRKRG